MLKLDARLWAEVSFSSGPRALRADTLSERFKLVDSRPLPNDLRKTIWVYLVLEGAARIRPSLKLSAGPLRVHYIDPDLRRDKDVVNYYNAGGFYSPNKSDLVKPMDLTDQEKQALVAFLNSLTGANR